MLSHTDPLTHTGGFTHRMLPPPFAQKSFEKKNYFLAQKFKNTVLL
jgi:hypothetical protein